MNNIEVVKELYRAFREQDYGAFVSITTDDIEWIQFDRTRHEISNIRNGSQGKHSNCYC